MGIYGDLQELGKANQQAAPVELPVKEDQLQSPMTASSLPNEVKIVNHDTVIPRHHETKQPRYHDTIVEHIRAAVKQFGKEAATHRFTSDEKKAIAEVIYNYGRDGIKTSENEISRIGVNFLVEDYKVNGEKSILNKVLKALNQ
jgi:hypothetical protein